jgi:hypothetical protein
VIEINDLRPTIAFIRIFNVSECLYSSPIVIIRNERLSFGFHSLSYILNIESVQSISTVS